MARTSVDQNTPAGALLNGYDYANQAWVKNGVYIRCGHPEGVHCACYGRIHAGESVKPERLGQNGHHIDCDRQDLTAHNLLCSLLCPLDSTNDSRTTPIMGLNQMRGELLIYGGFDQDELDRLGDRQLRDVYADYLGAAREAA